MQGRVVILILVKDSALITLKEKLDNVNVTGFGSKVERRLLILVLLIRITSSLYRIEIIRIVVFNVTD